MHRAAPKCTWFAPWVCVLGFWAYYSCSLGAIIANMFHSTYSRLVSFVVRGEELWRVQMLFWFPGIVSV